MKLYEKILFACLCTLPFLQSNAQQKGVPKIGVATSLENDSLLSAAGYTHIEEGARKLFGPQVSDSAYRRNLARIKSMKLDLLHCNGFLPGTIRLTGAEANEKEILGYVDTLMQRAQEAGVKIITFGSAGSRKLNDGQDSATALRELIAISRKMAEVAKKYDRIIAIENLNAGEDNFINSLALVTYIAKSVNHPNFKITVDIYHMLRERENPQAIQAAAPGSYIATSRRIRTAALPAPRAKILNHTLPC